MPSPAALFWGMFFGAIGLGFFIYGKRQQRIVPLGCGLALMAYPWFVTSAWALLLVGVVLIAVPYFVRY